MLGQQWKKIKDNWLIILLVVVVIGALNLDFLGTTSISSNKIAYDGGYGMESVMMDSYMAPSGVRVTSSYYGGDDFAVDTDERKITKNANMNLEVERGSFDESASKIMNIITTSDSILINQNERQVGKGFDAYMTGSYNLKVDTEKYDSVIAQLKAIGEVTSFNENAADITEQFLDAESQLEVEKARLERYQDMLEEAEKIEDKINLNDRIFDQERTIKYLEERLENLDKRVDYSTVYISLREEESSLSDLSSTSFGDLLTKLWNSFVALLNFIAYILPWAIVIGLISWIYKLIKR
jgi:hypothetical protein